MLYKLIIVSIGDADFLVLYSTEEINIVDEGDQYRCDLTINVLYVSCIKEGTNILDIDMLNNTIERSISQEEGIDVQMSTNNVVNINDYRSESKLH